MHRPKCAKVCWSSVSWPSSVRRDLSFRHHRPVERQPVAGGRRYRLSLCSTGLKNMELLSYQWVESNSGPPRKYYQLTDKGRQFSPNSTRPGRNWHMQLLSTRNTLKPWNNEQGYYRPILADRYSRWKNLHTRKLDQATNHIRRETGCRWR